MPTVPGSRKMTGGFEGKGVASKAEQENAKSFPLEGSRVDFTGERERCEAVTGEQVDPNDGSVHPRLVG